MKKMGKKGVKIKMIAPHDEKIARKLKSNIETVNKETNSRIIMVDDKEVLFMISDGKNDKHNDCGVWVKSEFFTKGLKDILRK